MYQVIKMNDEFYWTLIAPSLVMAMASGTMFGIGIGFFVIGLQEMCPVSILVGIASGGLGLVCAGFAYMLSPQT